MNVEKSIPTLFKGFYLLIAIIALSLFTVGGCNDNGGDGSLGSEGPVTDTSACEILTNPCSTVTSTTATSGTTTVQCVVSEKSCAVKLDNVISQINGSGFSVSKDSIVWIGAWGGVGGGADDGGGTSTPGYAQFTTTVSDISTNYNTNILHYFLGGNGLFAPKRCGGSGGAGTIITREDLTLNPASDPTEDLVLMIAGGGGGAGGSRANGCVGAVGETGGSGEPVISGTDGNKSAAGGGCNYNVWGCDPSACGDCVGQSASGASFTAEGGGSGSADSAGATGGGTQCCVSNDNPTPGNDKFGGRGGDGGQGDNCTKVNGGRYFNTGSVVLSFDAGKGGNGGGENKACVKGGGGGGGGYGGGGGGGRGNDNNPPNEGGAGGSYAIQSSQSSSSVPKSEPYNPCTDSGNPKGKACFILNFIED